LAGHLTLLLSLQVRSDEALIKKAEGLQVLIDAQDAILTIGVETRFLSVNRAGGTMFAHPAKEDHRAARWRLFRPPFWPLIAVARMGGSAEQNGPMGG
jgi:hypothetical protein